MGDIRIRLVLCRRSYWASEGDGKSYFFLFGLGRGVGEGVGGAGGSRLHGPDTSSAPRCVQTAGHDRVVAGVLRHSGHLGTEAQWFPVASQTPSEHLRPPRASGLTLLISSAKHFCGGPGNLLWAPSSLIFLHKIICAAFTSWLQGWCTHIPDELGHTEKPRQKPPVHV